jgi:protein-disulfide isomerase
MIVEPQIPERSHPLSSNRPTSKSATRRERRAAERDQRRQATPKPSGLSVRIPPIVWITGAAIAVGVLVIIIAVVAIGGSGGPSVALTRPAELAPSELIDGRSIGAADAPAQMDVWEDFQCPGCGIFSRDVEPRLINQYVRQGKLRMTYHDFAFLGQESLDAAVAARCAGDQGQFWHYMQYVYANQRGENLGQFSRAFLDSVARELGLDMNAFSSCLAGTKAKQAVADETNQGGAIPVSSTPTLIVNGQKVASLEFGVITKAIDDAIAAAQGGTPAPGSPAASPSPAVSSSPATTPTPTP